MAWTYFSPELTLKEMELVENKDQEYMRSFKLLNNADVSEADMKLSSSSSKYVSAYCRRKTITIDCQNFPNAIQESDSAKNEKFTPSIELNTTDSVQSDDLIGPKIVETMSLTEGEPLLVQNNLARRTCFPYTEKHKLLCFVILMLIIGTVGFSVYFKEKINASTTSSITLTLPASTIKNKYQDAKEAVLMLSTRNSGNVPMVITSTGEYHFDFCIT